MKRIWYQLPDFQATGAYRAILPCRFLREPLLAEEGIELDLRSEFTTDDVKKYDAFVFHRYLSPGFMPTLLKIKEMGKTVVWEVDDDLVNIPEWSPARNTTEERFYFRLAIMLADHVIVSTEPLGCSIEATLKQALDTKVQSDLPKIHTCPNLVDLDCWPKLQPREVNDPLRIVWAGSATHEKDLELLIDPIDAILREFKGKVCFIFFGYIHEEIARRWLGKGVFFEPAVSYQDYPCRLASLQPDLGLCPLVDDSFNLCKSPIKWMEYTLAGAATIASNVGPYNDVLPYGIMPLPHGEQTSAIGHFLTHEEARSKLAERSMSAVRTHFSWQSEYAIQPWLNAFRSIAHG